MVAELLEALDPARYLRRLGYAPYEWQDRVLDEVARGSRRIAINGARQAGKSTVVAGIPVHAVRSFDKVLALVFATSERQSSLVIEKALDYVRSDADLLVSAVGADHIAFEDGCQIVALPSTEKTVRGHSSPRVIILDEASRMEDALHVGIRPMLTDNPRCVEILISTPWGKRGMFHRVWGDPSWTRIEVRAPWDIEGGALVPARPEAEYRAERAREGIIAFYSPRHRDRSFMQEELDLIGERWFRQEYLCEFVDPADSAFDYGQIEEAFGRSGATPLLGRSIGAAEPLFAGVPG